MKIFRKYLIVCLLLPFSFLCYSQDVSQKVLNCNDLEVINDTTYLNGELFTGTCFLFDANGNKNAQFSLKNGILHGEIILRYFENGSPETISTYKDNERYGIEKSFFESGHLREEGWIINEEKDGEWISYYENGKVSLVENYDNGILNGTFKVFKSDGKLEMEGSFKNGLQDGKWIIYDINTGEPEIIFEMDEGGLQYDESPMENLELILKLIERDK